MRIRRATVDELLAVRHRVLRPGRPFETARFEGDLDPLTRHWVVEDPGVVATVSVMPAPCPVPSFQASWQLRGMAVLPARSGVGLGAKLLAHLTAEVDAPMWCNARERALSFYLRAGWTILSDSFDVPRVGPHRRMGRTP